MGAWLTPQAEVIRELFGKNRTTLGLYEKAACGQVKIGTELYVEVGTTYGKPGIGAG